MTEQDQYKPVQLRTLYMMHVLEVNNILMNKALEAGSHLHSCSQQDKEHIVGSVKQYKMNDLCQGIFHLYMKTTA